MCYQLPLFFFPLHAVHLTIHSHPPNPPIIYPASHNLKNNPCFPGRIGSLFFLPSINSSFLPSRLGNSLLQSIHTFLNTFFSLGFFFVHTITLLLPPPHFFSFFIFIFPFPSSSLLHARWLASVSFFLWFGLVSVRFGNMVLWAERIVVGQDCHM